MAEKCIELHAKLLKTSLEFLIFKGEHSISIRICITRDLPDGFTHFLKLLKLEQCRCAENSVTAKKFKAQALIEIHYLFIYFITFIYCPIAEALWAVYKN